MTPSSDIIQLLSAFSVGMTAPTFANALTLLYGVILAPGRRTVASALRVMGLAEEAHHGKFHRVFSRARWRPMDMSRILLVLLVAAFLAEGAVLVIVADETLERRAGKKIVYKGWFRDAVRSAGNKVAVTLGIRWLCLCLLVPVPWSTRPWALPFLVVPVLSDKTCKRLGKPHRSAVWWTQFLLQKARAWFPKREIDFIADGGFAAVELVACCQKHNIRMIARLRTDAKLFAFPGSQPKSKRGPKPQKGARLPSLAAVAAHPKTAWLPADIPWYGGESRSVEYCTGVCLWHKPHQKPVPIRWVLARHWETNKRTGEVHARLAAFLCGAPDDPTFTPERILATYRDRWNIEVTFEEMRAHLGFETQRHWSKRAICRATPCLFAAFSLVVLMAHRLHPETLPIQTSGWYDKEQATFSDALAAVRTHLWSARNNLGSCSEAETCLIPKALWRQVQQVLAYAA